MYHTSTGAVKEADDVTHQIVLVITLYVVVGEGIGGTIVVIVVHQGVGARALNVQHTVHGDVLGHHAAHRLGVASAVGVVDIIRRDTVLGHSSQFPSVLPREGRSVVVGQGVADGVVGDGIAVIRSQQVFPHAVPVGVRVGRTTCAGQLVSPEEGNPSSGPLPLQRQM